MSSPNFVLLNYFKKNMRKMELNYFKKTSISVQNIIHYRISI